MIRSITKRFYPISIWPNHAKWSGALLEFETFETFRF